MIIKKPGKGHPHFRLMERKDRKYLTIQHPELDAINKDYRAGADFSRSHALVALLRETLNKAKKKKLSWLPENMQIAEDYWKEVASQREQRRPEEAMRRIKRAVRLLGSTPLATSTPAELKAALSHLNANQRYRTLQVLSALSKWKGYGKTILAGRKQHNPITYLLPDEVAKVAALAEPMWALLIWTAYATGCRYGELFDLTRFSMVGEGHLNVTNQRYKDWGRGPTKNGKTGKVYVMKELRGQVRAWLDLPEETKRSMRTQDHNFPSLCLKAIGRREVIKNLRHSYAKAMLERGATLMHLRIWMRDLSSTIETYYANWELSSTGMEDDLRRFG